jgi:hypothetical protein
MSNDITTWLHAYRALLDHASSLRGVVVLDTSGKVERWPHTTGAEIILIAALVDPVARGCDRHGTARRWRHACSSIDPVALRRPTTPYPENRAFWRDLAGTFIDLHAARVPVLSDAAWLALFGQLDEVARHRNDLRNDRLPPAPFGPFPDTLGVGDQFRAQMTAMDTLRGFDVMDAPPGHGFGGNGFKVPRATNADVRALADYWGALLTMAKNVPGFESVQTKWLRVLTDVNALANKDKPNELYPPAKSNEFFRELPNVASKVNEVIVRMTTKTNVNDFLDSLVDSVKHLPQTLGDAAKYVGDRFHKAAGAAAHAAGEVVHEIGAGAFSGLGMPLLVGAAGITGLILLTRRSGDAKEA